MSHPDRLPEPGPGGARSFATTRWSLVVTAARQSRPQARAALATLCETYWYPLYCYVRRRGHPAEEAQDLTQEFFAVLLEKRALRVADPERGRFRSFLLGALNHFLNKQRRRERARKRGGGRPVLSLDLPSAESRYSQQPSHDLTPEEVYERRWALVLIDRALSHLREEYAAGGKSALFERLAPLLGGRGSVPYSQVAADLGMTEAAVKVAVHRLRRRCRHYLRAEVAHTVADPADVDEELRHLMTAVGR